MTRLEDYFSELEPPHGGLERLRDRLDGPPRRHLPRTAMAFSVAAMAIVAGLLSWPGTVDRERKLLAEMEAILMEARTPALAIDGHEPTELQLDHARALVYWLDPKSLTAVDH
ncbi:MAG: hypothetical protein ACNA7J_06640 [Wenzhouxiangella sp.]